MTDEQTEKWLTYGPSYDMLPDYMQEPARRYVEDGQLPGHFLQAVLRNELVEATLRADTVNRACLQVWAGWLYDQVPMSAWGSGGKVAAWSLARKNEKTQQEAEHAVETQQERTIAAAELMTEDQRKARGL